MRSYFLGAQLAEKALSSQPRSVVRRLEGRILQILD